MKEPCLYCKKDPCECPWNQKSDPKFNVRNNDPITSHRAAYQTAANRVCQKQKVWLALDVAKERGLTDDELQIATGIECLSSAGKRRGELMREGEVVDSGKERKTRTGSPAVVWILKKYMPQLVES